MTGPHKSELSRDRYALLQKGLLRLMRVHGYLSITVKEICEEAGIPRRTFYHYYNSKEELLDAVIEDTLLPSFMAAMFDFQNSVEETRQSFVRFFRYWQGDARERLLLLMANSMESRLIAYAIRWTLMENAVKLHNEKMSEIHMSFARTIGAASFFALLFHWCKRGFLETPEELSEYVVWFLTNPLVERNG